MVEVTRRATPVSGITQVIHPVQTDRKKELLKAILKNGNMHQTLVFTRTKARAHQLAKILDKSGYAATAIHSNFELPDTPEDYVHRIGRTARAGGRGNAISLVAPHERNKLAAIERLIKKPIKQEPVSGFIVTTDASKLGPIRKPKRQPTTLSRRKLNRSKDASFSRNGKKQTLRAGRKKSQRKGGTRDRQKRSTRTAG